MVTMKIARKQRKHNGTYKHCQICSRALTVRQSQETGICVVCVKKTEKVAIKTYKNELFLQGKLF
jgi:hypothetical protein